MGLTSGLVRKSPAFTDLSRTYVAGVAPLRKLATEALALERHVSDLVNSAYGLIPAEVDLLWRTAPPRMPLAQHNGTPSEEIDEAAGGRAAPTG